MNFRRFALLASFLLVSTSVFAGGALPFSLPLAAIQSIRPAGFDQVATLFSILAPVLLILGIIGAYLEIKTPGFGVPGLVATACFALFFAGSYLSGLAGWEAPLVFLVGLGLILSEVFLHPGTILPGLTGLVLAAGSLLWALVDRGPSQPFWPTGAMLVFPLIKLLLAFTLAAVAIFFLAKYFPQSTVGRWLVLKEETPAGEALKPGDFEAEYSAGMRGIARTTLRPSGKADFAGRLVDVVTRGDYIESGTAIRVLAIEGPRIVVAAET